MLNKFILSVGILLGLTSACFAKSKIFQNDIKYALYEKTTFGTLAYLPTILRSSKVNSAVRFQIIPESGTYDIDKQQSYCFIINHKIDEKDNQPYAYVGIAIVSFYEEDANIGYSSVRYSNNWIRSPEDPKYNRENKMIKSLKDITVSDFFKLHESIEDLNRFDEAIGVNWHGLIAGTDISSWAKRKSWNLAERLNKKLPLFLRNTKNIRIDAQLISFQPTTNNETKLPLKFCINGDKKIGVYIYTFFDRFPSSCREYIIIFNK